MLGWLCDPGEAQPVLTHLDAEQERLADALALGFQARGSASERVRAVVALALDFWTWRRLARDRLGDEEAADLLTDLAVHAARAA